MTHVLLTPSWYPTPDNLTIGSFFREQAHALKKAGLEVGVIAPQLRSVRLLGRSGRGLPTGIEYWDDGGIPTWLKHGYAWLPRIPHGDSYLWLKAGHALWERYLSRHGRPDLIHAHSSLYGGVLAAEIGRRYGIPYVVTEHGTCFARNVVPAWQMRLTRMAFGHARARIAVSPELGRLLEARFDHAMRPWTCIPNMVDRMFRPPDAESGRKDHSCFRFLNVAFLREKKGQADLLRATALAFQGDRSVQLRIGGDGPCRGRLADLAGQLGIQDQVAFLGNLKREAVLAEMQSCDAFVLSSHFETFGVVVIEALACGKPVIATICGGPESIIQGANGRLVSPRNERHLAEAMIKMREEIADYDGESIRRECLSRFGEEALVRRLLAVYQDVTGLKGPLAARREQAA